MWRSAATVATAALKKTVPIAAVSIAAVVVPRTRFSTACEGGCPAHGGTSTATAAVRRKRKQLDALKEHVDFAVFRRLSSPSGPFEGAEKVATPAARSANLKEAIRAIAGEGSDAAPSVVLLGEVHDDTVAHRLQLEILQQCANICQLQGRRLVLSLEMFEVDVQKVMDEYVIHGSIREQDFLQDTRPWSNYVEHYRPLVETCKALVHSNHLPAGVQVVAANAPRRYVSLVSRGGTKALAKLVAAKPEDHLPPLPMPPPSPAFLQKFKEELSMQVPAPAQSSANSGSCPYIGFSYEAIRQVRPEMLEAQSLWDHTMALSIARALERTEEEEKANAPPPLVLHVCGAFHCAHGLGIPEALPHYAPAFRSKDAKTTDKNEESNDVWLPIDDAFPSGGAAKQSEALVTEPVKPKKCPPGVLSIVCWPASVGMTLKVVEGGRVPSSLGDMADFVIVTDEMYDERNE
eukprot:CAMPEP_0206478778 /NCGR_PEP_ID=MMETSP0324_2-20121206/36276_1 /ASSEMBLY_ACC=CAM_ASM_000836 /TAXON_ID=2866 /ORGANISM="Crypthecodinium cohnii, Strain Seligo" /LENGTH=461 /DNA_ID=CAMNT_0053955189 /DNA_START=68 /DNA_END=1453 /DNA_ORIENTATION=+